MSILVLAEHNNTEINSSTLNTLTAAKKISSEITLLITGFNLSIVAEMATKIEGVAKTIIIDKEVLKDNLAEPTTDAVLAIANNYTHILGNSTAQGKDIMPRLAAKLDVMQISDITDVISADTFERLIYAGNAIITVKSKDPKKVITVRSTAFEPANIMSSSISDVENLEIDITNNLSDFISHNIAVNNGPELATSEIVVSGGRGMGSKDNFFSLLTPLADKLNAAIGASRAAVDSEYCSNSYQVGQTGKVIAPNLYVAIGISGAIQHQAGMKDSKIIVAINNDPDAPIFQIADYGLVADLNDVIPELTGKL